MESGSPAPQEVQKKESLSFRQKLNEKVHRVVDSIRHKEEELLNQQHGVGSDRDLGRVDERTTQGMLRLISDPNRPMAERTAMYEQLPEDMQRATQRPENRSVSSQPKKEAATPFNQTAFNREVDKQMQNEEALLKAKWNGEGDFQTRLSERRTQVEGRLRRDDPRFGGTTPVIETGAQRRSPEEMNREIDRQMRIEEILLREEHRNEGDFQTALAERRQFVENRVRGTLGSTRPENPIRPLATVAPEPAMTIQDVVLPPNSEIDEERKRIDAKIEALTQKMAAKAENLNPGVPLDSAPDILIKPDEAPVSESKVEKPKPEFLPEEDVIEPAREVVKVDRQFKDDVVRIDWDDKANSALAESQVLESYLNSPDTYKRDKGLRIQQLQSQYKNETNPEARKKLQDQLTYLFSDMITPNSQRSSNATFESDLASSMGRYDNNDLLQTEPNETLRISPNVLAYYLQPLADWEFTNPAYADLALEAKSLQERYKDASPDEQQEIAQQLAVNDRKRYLLDVESFAASLPKRDDEPIEPVISVGQESQPSFSQKESYTPQDIYREVAVDEGDLVSAANNLIASRSTETTETLSLALEKAQSTVDAIAAATENGNRKIKLNVEEFQKMNTTLTELYTAQKGLIRLARELLAAPVSDLAEDVAYQLNTRDQINIMKQKIEEKIDALRKMNNGETADATPPITNISDAQNAAA